jgi:hypothetical protein
MKRNSIAGIVMILTAITVGAKEVQSKNLCYEYPATSYILINERVEVVKNPRPGEKNYRSINARLETGNYRLILVRSRPASRSHIHTVTLMDKKKNIILDTQYFQCPDRASRPDRYYCYGECDGGIIGIERDGRIHFKTDRISIGETIDDPRGMWSIYPLNDPDLPRPESIPCPDDIATSDLDLNRDNPAAVDSDIAQLVRPMRYVCYHSKRNSSDRKHPVYQGCRMTRGSCDGFMHLKRFGYYPTEAEAKKALIRCQQSALRN